ncbi:MAG TPA: FadR/GntR family transcriptional regulator [Xanthobacteraceae bacterium]|nr:FadR/GntR family transcriptional regulator [Xanthobacteraceae bacterium]
MVQPLDIWTKGEAPVRQKEPSSVLPAKPVFQAVEQPRLYVAIARQIAEQIRQAPLPPGTQLPPERDLAQQFQVSRTTVREAMIALETMGLIEVKVGDGTYVRSPADAARAPWERGGDPGPGPHEQFRARELIECAAAGDAAVHITEAELAELARLLDAMERDLDGPTAEADRFAFHDVVARAARNSILIGVVRELWDMRSGDMWRTIRDRVVKPEHHVQALKDRRAIYECLRRRDGDGAVAAMQRLMDRIRKRYFEQIDP